VDERDHAYFGRNRDDSDKIGYIDAKTRAVFGRSYAAEPDVLIAQLAQAEAVGPAQVRLPAGRDRVPGSPGTHA
jgi:hypothetical protein